MPRSAILCAGKDGDRIVFTSGLLNLSGWVPIVIIAALVFGEFAVFLGFVFPGETAVVLGGVLASRGHVQLAELMVAVVIAAILGPLVGYEIGKRLGDRIFAARPLRKASGAVQWAQDALRSKGGLTIFLGRFLALLRPLVPAAAGAARVSYRTFIIFNIVGGVVWGIGYCLLGYLAGSAYQAIEQRVGTGLAIGIAAIVVTGVAVWTIRRHRAQQMIAARHEAAAEEAAAAASSEPPAE